MPAWFHPFSSNRTVCLEKYAVETNKFLRRYKKIKTDFVRGAAQETILKLETSQWSCLSMSQARCLASTFNIYLRMSALPSRGQTYPYDEISSACASFYGHMNQATFKLPFLVFL